MMRSFECEINEEKSYIKCQKGSAPHHSSGDEETWAVKCSHLVMRKFHSMMSISYRVMRIFSCWMMKDLELFFSLEVVKFLLLISFSLYFPFWNKRKERCGP